MESVKSISHRASHHILLTGILFCFIYWITESVVHKALLPQEDFSTHFFMMDSHEVWNRLLVIFILIGFSIYSQYISNSRRKAEKSLIESEKRYRTIFEEALNPIFIFGESGNLLDSNSAALEFLACSKSTLRKKEVSDLLFPRSPSNPSSDFDLLTKRRNFEFDCDVQGEMKTLILNVVPLFNDAQKLVYVIGQDISERKQMENEIKAAHAELEQIFQTASVGMCLVSVDFAVLKINETLAAMTGKRRLEATGQKCYELMGCTMCKTEKCPLEVILQGETNYEGYLTKQWEDGSPHHFILTATPFCDAAGNVVGIVESFKDITDLVQAEQVIRSERDKVQRIVSHLIEAVSVIDLDCTIEYQSEVCIEHFGEHLGEKCYSLVYDSDKPCRDCPVTEAVANQATLSKEHTLSDGRIYECTYTPFPDVDGQTKVIVLTQDITEKKTSLRAAMHAEQLAVLGELAAGVAHEINNPINGIINYAQIIVNKTEEENVINEIASMILKEGDRIANIVEGLLSFAQRKKGDMIAISVNDIIRDALTLTAAQLRRDGIVVRANADNNLPRIVARLQEIEQVFINIISNARHALNAKFKGRHKDKVLEVITDIVKTNDRSYVRVTFHDKGIGIPSSILDKVMNPFFTTKTDSRSTGLGLSISHGIVSDHGGKLIIHSVEGVFTNIHVDLPIEQRSIH